MKYQNVDRISRVRTILNCATQCKIIEKRGEFQVNSWVLEDNMAHEEHKRIFGSKSPLFTAVGIMTDTGDI